MRTFSDELANAEITLKKNQMFTEIDTQHNIIEICLRLESSIRYEWRNRVMKNKQSTADDINFSEFMGFIHEQADIVNDPLYGKDVLKDRPKKVVMGISVSSSPVATRSTCSLTPNLMQGCSLILKRVLLLFYAISVLNIINYTHVINLKVCQLINDVTMSVPITYVFCV